jgi:hypothetical protein
VAEDSTIFRAARALARSLARALAAKHLTGFRTRYSMLARFDGETPPIGF